LACVLILKMEAEDADGSLSLKMAIEKGEENEDPSLEASVEDGDEEEEVSMSSSPSLLHSSQKARNCHPTITDAVQEEISSPIELRLRFFGFNMANSSAYEDKEAAKRGAGLSNLQGPGGRGLFDLALTEPFKDGSPVDLFFATLVETRLHLTEWVREYLSRKRSPLDKALNQNALHAGEAAASDEMVTMKGLLASAAEKYNGNLKSILAYNSEKFSSDEDCAALFGRLIETKVGGLAIPNPKKAFMGRTLSLNGESLRFCFASAHFPVSDLAAALEDTAEDPLESAKIVMAKTLRRVLRRACSRGIADSETIIILQGDLNSRTVLQNSGLTDVLTELLHDKAMQTAMRSGLAIPTGEWQEIVPHPFPSALPVTYKYSSDVGEYFQRECRCAAERVGSPAPTLTLGDIAFASPFANRFSAPPEGRAELYKMLMKSFPEGQLRNWGLDFKENSFRPFRFPSSADRIIYWAPRNLSGRISWTLPQGGYEVNHLQGGSDHRPVSLETILTITPPSADDPSPTPVHSHAEVDPARFQTILHAICQADTGDSDDDQVDSPRGHRRSSKSTKSGGKSGYGDRGSVASENFFNASTGGGSSPPSGNPLSGWMHRLANRAKR